MIIYLAGQMPVEVAKDVYKECEGMDRMLSYFYDKKGEFAMRMKEELLDAKSQSRKKG